MSRKSALVAAVVLAAAASPFAVRSGCAPAAPSTASFRFPAAAAAAAVRPAPPLSLTASDGTGLELVALQADAVLVPPLAFTELRLAFDNPRDEVIEGRFRIALPPGAALSRFAMKIDGRWQEGEVVERQRAREVYEDFLHRRQDPALLEQEAGNEFSARVFPIPARGRKELIVSYSHALPRADEPYRLPLAGLPRLGTLDLRVLLGSRPAAGAPASNLGGEAVDRRVVELHRRDWLPDRDFEVAQDRAGGGGSLRHGDLAVVRVAPAIDAAPQEIAGLFVLVDSSASRALGWPEQVRLVAGLAAGLARGAGSGAPFAVAAFDQELATVYEGTAGGFGEAQAARLLARRPLGASDLEAALAGLSGRLAGGRFPRVLVVTDGVATAGETEPRALKAAAAALGRHGVERLDALAVGGLRDTAALAELVTGNLRHDGRVLDGALPLEEIGRRLTLACRSAIEVAVDGAAWVWPARLDGVQPGDQVLVFADLPAEDALVVRLDGRPVDVDAAAEAPRPLLERAWVQARIERLLHLRETAHAGDPDLARALASEAARLSVEHRVLSPFTAFLVLETEWDYRRFGLDRTALADILTVGPGGLEVAARSHAAEPADAGRRETAKRQPSLVPSTARPEARSSGVEMRRFADVPLADADEAPREAPGDVESGLAGGAPGGLAEGFDSPEPTQPVEVPQPEVEAPLRIGAPPPAARMEPPRPSRRRPAPAPQEGREGRAEEIVVSDAPRRQLRVGSGPSGEEKRPQVAPYSGRFGEVLGLLAAGRAGAARDLAEAWQEETPGDVLALLALGEAWEAAGDLDGAARAYGSLIDLFPGRADLRRAAGERLERLGEAGLALAIDSYEKAVADRPDHPSGHRLLAWALLSAGRTADAFAALERGLARAYPAGRFAGVDQVLREDFGLLGAAWLRAEPDRRGEVVERLRVHGARVADAPSLRFALTWETDANDVDLHVHDRNGDHAYYHQPALPSGGRLVADVTTGYGPEGFAIAGPAVERGAPYRLSAHYYRRGPMGYGLGLLQVVEHDGAGRLTVDPRPFVVMADDAWVELGTADGGRPRKGGG